MNGNNSIDRNRYDYLKSKLLTHSPTELSTTEGISVGLGYKIMASKNWNDFRNRQQEDNRKAYNMRKGIEPTPIKKNVPPLGSGQFRMTNSGINKGYDPNERVFGSPFRSEDNSKARVIIPPYNPPQTVVDVKSGSQLSGNKPDKRVDDFRQLNNLISIKKDGVDAYQFVDRTKLVSNRRLPQFFKDEEIDYIAGMIRQGYLDSEVLAKIKEKYNRGMTMEAVFRVAAFDQKQLDTMKQAWKEGEPRKLERRSSKRSAGGQMRGRLNNVKSKTAGTQARPTSLNDTPKVNTEVIKQRLEPRNNANDAKADGVSNEITIPAGDKKITIQFTITIE